MTAPEDLARSAIYRHPSDTLFGRMLPRLLHAPHWTRLRRNARLFFGPGTGPRPWVHSVPFARALAGGGLAWGLMVLLQIEPTVHMSDDVPDSEYRHLVLVLVWLPLALPGPIRTIQRTPSRSRADGLGA